MKPFKEKVLDIVARIPEGETMTYKEVALAAGNPNASRAVGMIMSRNYRPDVPCHRVIRSDGSLAGYNRGGAEAKSRLLAKEGALL